MGFAIDHAAFIAQLESLWDLINPLGITGFVLNVVCAFLIYLVFRQLSEENKSEPGE